MFFFLKKNTYSQCTSICKTHHARKLNTQESQTSTHKSHSHVKLSAHTQNQTRKSS